jgi:hypothetical protein
LLNTTYFCVCFYPNPLEIFHLYLCNWNSKTMATNLLLKKRINPTPYSPILYFRKENTPVQPSHSPLIILTWNCQNPLVTLSHLNTPWCNFFKLRLPHMVVLIWLIVNINGQVMNPFNQVLIISFCHSILMGRIEVCKLWFNAMKNNEFIKGIFTCLI